MAVPEHRNDRETYHEQDQLRCDVAQVGYQLRLRVCSRCMQIEHEQRQYDREDAICERRHPASTQTLRVRDGWRFFAQPPIDGFIRAQVNARDPHGAAFTTDHTAEILRRIDQPRAISPGPVNGGFAIEIVTIFHDLPSLRKV